MGPDWMLQEPLTVVVIGTILSHKGLKLCPVLPHVVDNVSPQRLVGDPPLMELASQRTEQTVTAGMREGEGGGEREGEGVREGGGEVRQHFVCR